MFSNMSGRRKLSSEISVALRVLGYNKVMMEWRRDFYDRRSKIFNPFLNNPPRNIGSAKMDIQLTGGKQDGSSISGNSNDEDMMVIIDRCVCVDDTGCVYSRQEYKEHVHFQIQEVQDSPGYVYLKKCPLTKLDLDNSTMDRLVFSSCNKNGYLSSQNLNKITYEVIKTSEEQLKMLIIIILFLLPYVENIVSAKSIVDLWIETENEEHPNIIIKYTGFGTNSIDVLYAVKCDTKGCLDAWANRKRQHDWPSSSVIEEVLKMPVHIVPKGCKGSKTRAIEFRLSYVFSEMALMRSLNETQSKLYSLLKLLVKSTVGITERFQDILTSYCLKNVVFWIFEENSTNMFEDGSLLELLELCLEFIRDSIKKEQLSMYLMPERNLLEGKLHEGNKEDLIALITDQLSRLETIVFDTFPSIRKIVEDYVRVDQANPSCAELCFCIHMRERWLVTERMKALKQFENYFHLVMVALYINLNEKLRRC